MWCRLRLRYFLKKCPAEKYDFDLKLFSDLVCFYVRGMCRNSFLREKERTNASYLYLK